MTLLAKFFLEMGLCCIQFMTEPMRVHNEAFQDGVQSLVSHKSDPAVEPFHDPTAIGSKLFGPFNATTSYLRKCSRGWIHTTHLAGRMDSLVQKIRSLLEASWALSPTMVGLACVTLDLAALLHLRIKAAQPAAAEIVRRPGLHE